MLMKYDRIEIVQVHDKKRSHKSLKYRVTQFHSGIKDTTGLGGTWSGSGHLCDVYQVGDVLVGMSIFYGGHPTHVWKDYDAMKNYFNTLSLEVNYRH